MTAIFKGTAIRKQGTANTVATWAHRFLSALTLCSMVGSSLLAGGARPAWAEDTKPVAQAESNDPEYLLGPDDVLTIVSPGHDELTQQVIVQPDGRISVAGIADPIKAEGKTLRQLRQEIFTGLDRLYNNLQLTIGLKEINSKLVTIVGARQGGRVRLLKGMRVSGLIGFAGGVPTKTKYVKGFLIRDGVRTDLDMQKIIGIDPDPAADIELKAADTVILDYKEEAPPPTYSVAGAVQKGGSFPMPLDGTPIPLARAVADAGGRTERAALTRVRLVRKGEEIKLNLYPLLVEGKTDNKESVMTMQDGDLLIIPDLDAKYMVVGEVNRPTTAYLPEARTVTVTQALTDGGGPTSNADLRQAFIQRTVNGERTLMKIDIRELLTKSDAKARKDKQGNLINKNIAMQDGDVLYIPSKKKGITVQDITNPLWVMSMFGLRIFR